jgi:hypothetical protein
VAGLGYPTLAGSARRDADMLEAAPTPGGWLRWLGRIPHLWTWLPVGAAIAIAVAFGYARVGITAVYTESIVFLCFAVALGMLAPGAALLMALVFMPLDLATALQARTLDPMIPAVAGRVISWWMLLVLAVAIPLACRGIPAAAIAAPSPRDPIMRRLLGYPAAGGVGAVLVWLWTQAAPLLTQPVFTWSDALRAASAGTQVVAAEWENVVTAALFALMATVLLRDALGSLDEEAIEIDAAMPPTGARGTRLLPDQSQIALQLLAAAFFTLMLGGIVREPVEILILFVTLAVAGPAIRFVLVGAPAVALPLARVPWLARFLLGIVLGLTVAFALMVALSLGAVLAVAAGLVIFELLLQPDVALDEIAIRRQQPRPEVAGPTAPAVIAGFGGLVVGGLALAGTLSLVPSPARAADAVPPASSTSAFARASAAQGAATMVMITMVAGRHVSARQNRGRLRRKPRRRTTLAGPHATVTTTALDRLADEVSRVRDRALDNYRQG